MGGIEMKELLEEIREKYPKVYLRFIKLLFDRKAGKQAFSDLSSYKVFDKDTNFKNLCKQMTFHDLECFFDENKISVGIIPFKGNFKATFQTESYDFLLDFETMIIGENTVNPKIFLNRTEAKKVGILKACEILEEKLNETV